MVLLTPSSIVSTGTGNSSSIEANGSVSFTSCATLSLNGVFSADYDNYMINIRFVGSVVGVSNYPFRFRASGIDNSSASSYVTQRLIADSTSVSAVRQTVDYGIIGVQTSTLRSGINCFYYGPFLASPTAYRSTGIIADNNAIVRDHAGTHNQSVAYDGISFIDSTQLISGRVSVYGLVGA